MIPAARDAWLIGLVDALEDPAAMSEGRRHKKAKSAVIDALGLHFSAIGRAGGSPEEHARLAGRRVVGAHAGGAVSAPSTLR